MNQDKLLELAMQAGLGDSHGHLVRYYSKEVQRFAELVRDEALDEAADALYGNGLDMEVMIELRQQIRSLK